MTTPFLAREAVTATPYLQVYTKHGVTVANAGSLGQVFDMGVLLSDQNETGFAQASGLPSAGPFLDGFVFSSAVGTVDIQVSTGGTFRTILTAPIAVAVSTGLVYCSGLRVPSWLFQVIFTNTSGGDATVDFVATVRSN